MNLSEINNLDFSHFEGYLWFSNAEYPTFDIKELKELEENVIPFVIEGFLFDETNKQSISIKNFNGKYVITSFDLTNKNMIRFLEEHQYPANKMEGIEAIKKQKMQELIPDEDGFAVWQTVAEVFVGFKKY